MNGDVHVRVTEKRRAALCETSFFLVSKANKNNEKKLKDILFKSDFKLSISTDFISRVTTVLTKGSMAID